MTIREAVRRLLGAMLPWPGRQERKAAIASAQEDAGKAQAQAEHAARQAGEIRKIAYQDNHFASAIIDTLGDRYGRPGPRGEGR